METQHLGPLSLLRSPAVSMPGPRGPIRSASQALRSPDAPAQLTHPGRREHHPRVTVGLLQQLLRGSCLTQHFRSLTMDTAQTGE